MQFLKLAAIVALALSFAQSASAATIGLPGNYLTLSSGLVGYWPLDGKTTNWATGKTTDLSGQNNAGQLINMSTTTSPVAGKIGQALKFDGSSQYITTNRNIQTFCSVSTCSLSVWLYPTGSAVSVSASYNGQGALGDDTGNMGIYRANISGNDRIWAYNWDSGDRRVGVTYTPNTWVHIVWVHTGGVLYAYKNGVLVGSTASGDEAGPWNFQIGKGYTTGTSPYWPGRIDDVRIYNRALSASEVQALYNIGAANIAHSNTTALSSGLVGYWTFDGGATHWNTGKVDDVSGQNNTGQLINMSTTTSPVPGKIGQALKFNGVTNQYVNVGDLDTPNTMSVSIWVKSNKQPNQYFIGKDYTTSWMINASSASTNFWTSGAGNVPPAVEIRRQASIASGR
jgi:hypothetical protein